MTASLHDRDFYGWVQSQVQLLKAGRFQDIDLINLIDEVESMGASERRELMSRLEVLIVHLLKWKYQPLRRGKSWRLTIQEQRSRLADHLIDNPSLSNPDLMAEHIAKAYKYALILAQKQTNLSASVFPSACPFDLAQILDEDYYPDAVSLCKVP
jgi:hypothetical protein